MTPFTSMYLHLWTLFEAGLLRTSGSKSLDRKITVANFLQNPKTSRKKARVRVGIFSLASF